MQNTDQFLETLLQEKGMGDLMPEIKQQVMDELRAELNKQISRAAMMQLDEEKLNELDKLSQGSDFKREQLIEFVQNNGVNMEAVTQDVMAKFRDFYLGNEEQ